MILNINHYVICLGILLFCCTCTMHKEFDPENKVKEITLLAEEYIINEPVNAVADNSLDKMYARYVEKFGGEVREDYALVGPVDLLLNLSILPDELRDKIKYISINTRIENIPEFNGLRNLETTEFRALGIKQIENQESLRVENLSLVLNPLESIESIGKNSHIKRLNLSSSGLTRLPDMSGMKNLRVLGLLRSKIVSLDNIQTIPNSIDLNILECDELEDIDALRFAKIKRLYIGKDGINSIGGQGDTKGLYDKNKDWFDKYLPQLKGNEPEFEMFFYMKEE